MREEEGGGGGGGVNDNASTIRMVVKRKLLVTNIGAIRSNCMIHIPHDAAINGSYSVRPSFAVLEPGSVQEFVVTFSPTIQGDDASSSDSDHDNMFDEKKYIGTLHVVGTGRERYCVSLNGTSGSWLRLSESVATTGRRSGGISFEKTLSFGYVQSVGKIITRQLSFNNPSTKRTLPITLQPSNMSSFMLLNEDDENSIKSSLTSTPCWTILVPAGTSKIVKISYIASSIGEIVERITVLAPCSVPSIIRVTGFVGRRYIKFPFLMSFNIVARNSRFFHNLLITVFYFFH
jgi:hypothetical protein